MAEPVEAAIQIALLNKATAFATAQGLTIALPNGVGTDGKPFTPPAATPTAKWLRAAVLPVPTETTGIPYSSNERHYGYLQIDVLQGMGGGTVPMDRVIGVMKTFFPAGLELNNSGFTVVIRSHSRRQIVSKGPLMLEGAWAKVPVSIPYECFAKPA